MPRSRVPWRAAIPWICAALAGLTPPGTRAADPQPYAVTLAPTGDDAVDAALRDSSTLVSLRETAPVGPFALIQRAREDADRLETVLHGLGYYQARVAVTIDTLAVTDSRLPPRLDAAPAGVAVPVGVAVTRGPMFRLGQVRVEGAIPPAAHQALALPSGADAVAADILAARDRLVAALRDAGHPLAQVELPPATLHPDAATLDVVFIANAGPRAKLGRITLTGLTTVHEAFVRQRLLLRPGQAFSPAGIDAARQDLLGLGVFSAVRVEPATALDPDGTLPVRIGFDERKRHVVELGASYATDLGAGINAAWRHRNLFGNAEQLALSGSFRFGGSAMIAPSYDATARFVKPDFLARDQSLEISLTALRQSLKAYDQTALIGRVTLSRRLTPHWTVSLGVLSELEQIEQEGMRDNYNLVGLPLTAKYDSTNSLFDPTRGIRASLSVMPMQSLGHNPGTFVISQAAASTYVDIGGDGRSVVALRGLVGQAAGVGLFGLPPDQRFYAGGSGTVRGFRYQSVGPSFASGRPTGGTGVSAGTVEFRQRVLGDYGIVGFVDAGQVNADGNPFGGTWQVGAGLGLRYYTPIGPIRLDVAVPLNPRAGDDRVGVYIGIGQAF
jgi:translocation and assembly module TamA